jgi:hypothetical protein
MRARRPKRFAKPKLEPGMKRADFRDYYWLKQELEEFARAHAIPTHGNKPALSARIERWLRRLPTTDSRPDRPRGSRDSERPLTRRTPVVHYKSDAATRSFFESQIGPEFHFTYHLNQFRLRNAGLTYGDLVDEWVAERDRRRHDGYRAPIAAHGRYNRFIRAFFADGANTGKSLRDAAAAWNATKNRRGGARYRRRR